MDKLSFSEVMAILDGTELPFISIRQDGVFVDPKSLKPSQPEYAVIREMETNHPQKDITKPLFTFPCSVNKLRRLLHEISAFDQISGVIYLEKNKHYSAREIVTLMVQAEREEIEQHVPDELIEGSSFNWHKCLLDRHKNDALPYYEDQILKRVKQYALPECTVEQLDDVSFREISEVINWLQGLRFAVFETFSNEKTPEPNNLENLILATITELDFHPMSLPVGSGKTIGAKGYVWQKLRSKFLNRDQFDNIWKKLKADKKIADKK